MSQEPIVTDALTFEPFSAPSSNGDPAIWRVEDPSIAPMHRPTIRLSGKTNSTGTNANMVLKVQIPVVQVVGGIAASSNTAIASANVTALQNVTGEDVDNCIDALIAGLTQLKVSIVAGKTLV